MRPSSAAFTHAAGARRCGPLGPRRSVLASAPSGAPGGGLLAPGGSSAGTSEECGQIAALVCPASSRFSHPLNTQLHQIHTYTFPPSFPRSSSSVLCPLVVVVSIVGFRSCLCALVGSGFVLGSPPPGERASSWRKFRRFRRNRRNGAHGWLCRPGCRCLFSVHSEYFLVLFAPLRGGSLRQRCRIALSRSGCVEAGRAVDARFLWPVRLRWRAVLRSVQVGRYPPTGDRLGSLYALPGAFWRLLAPGRQPFQGLDGSAFRRYAPRASTPSGGAFSILDHECSK